MTEFTATPPAPATPTPEECATAVDRVWFAAHPFSAEYRRPMILGEFGKGLYYDGGTTHVTRFSEGLYYCVGQFAYFDDRDAVRIARTPQWRPWAPEGTVIPKRIRTADALYRTPEAQAVLALLEAEGKIRAGEGDAA
jgi:hypothetical protein